MNIKCDIMLRFDTFLFLPPSIACIFLQLKLLHISFKEILSLCTETPLSMILISMINLILQIFNIFRTSFWSITYISYSVGPKQSIYYNNQFSDIQMSIFYHLSCKLANKSLKITFQEWMCQKILTKNPSLLAYFAVWQNTWQNL